jgi:hypothetical protein
LGTGVGFSYTTIMRAERTAAPPTTRRIPTARCSVDELSGIMEA